MTLEERIEKIEQRLDAIEKESCTVSIDAEAIKKAIAERSVNRNPVPFPESFL